MKKYTFVIVLVLLSTFSWSADELKPSYYSWKIRRINLRKSMPLDTLKSAQIDVDKINSILREIETNGVKKGVFDFKNTEVKTFKEPHVLEILERMGQLRDKLYLLSASVDKIDSSFGATVVGLSGKYLQLLEGIYTLMAKTYHKYGANDLDFTQLSKFNLILTKNVAIEIMSKKNLKAKHLDLETVMLSVSEMEKQSYEFYALNEPRTVGQYAKLVHFMSLRELLTNKWGLERISNEHLDNPVVSFCGPGLMSYRVGADKTMGSSALSKELVSFDNYFAVYAPILDQIKLKSSGIDILSREQAREFVENYIAAIPTLPARLIQESGWSEKEVDDWKQVMIQSISLNEVNEWNKHKENVFKVALFPGDQMNSSSVEKRLAEDVFSKRREAIVVQVDKIMDRVTEDERKTMEETISKYMDQRFVTWEIEFKKEIRPLLKYFDDHSLLARKNYTEKVSSTSVVAAEALSSAYFQDQVSVKKLKENMSGPKLNILDLEPKNLGELLNFFKAKIDLDPALKHVIGVDPSKEKIVNDFFLELKAKSMNETDGLSIRKSQTELFKIAYEVAQKFYRNYPLTKKEAKQESKSFSPRPVAFDRAMPQVLKNQFIDVSKIPKGPRDLNPVSKAPLKITGRPLQVVAVSDNTKVQIAQKITPNSKKKEDKSESSVVRINDINDLSDDGIFVRKFLSGLNLVGASKSFLKDLNDQNIIANMRLSKAYSNSALLKIPLPERIKVSAGGVSSAGTFVTKDIVGEKPALVHMAVAFRLNSDGTHQINRSLLVEQIKKTITQAFENQKGKTDVFCKANSKNPSTDDNFKTVFRSSTFIRHGLLNAEMLPSETASRLEALDKKLKNETRYWSEEINEEYIDPMLNIAMVFILVSSIVSGFLAPGGTLLMVLASIDAVDFATSMTSIYFQSASNFYEVPAQQRFQRSLAYTQLKSENFTKWDDVKEGEKKLANDNAMRVVFTPLDLMSIQQFYNSSRRVLGYTGKALLEDAGVATRGFGSPMPSPAPSLSLKEMMKQKGVMKGVTEKVVDEMGKIKYWAPRYQPVSKVELTGLLRKQLVAKAKSLSLAAEPWKLEEGFESMMKVVAERLVVTQDSNKVLMRGSLQWKEFLEKSSVSHAWLVPKSFMKAIQRGRVDEYFRAWKDTLKAMSILRGRFLEKKLSHINLILEKLEQVKKMAATDPQFLETHRFDNWMDYFQSLMSDKDLIIFQGLAKSANHDGRIHSFITVFEDHKEIMETIIPTEGADFVRMIRPRGGLAQDIEDLFTEDGNAFSGDSDISPLIQNLSDSIR